MSTGIHDFSAGESRRGFVPRLLAALVVGCLAPALLAAAPAVAAPAWLAPVRLSATGEFADQAQVAVDARGDAVAVWRLSERIIQAATRPAGGAWSAPVNISTTGENARAPQVAVNSRGDAVAVWLGDRSGYIIQAATRPSGGAWSAPADVSVVGPFPQLPQVAIDSRGDAVAIWGRLIGTDLIAQAATRPAGGVWSAPANLSAAGLDAQVPQVAVDADGDAVAVWRSSDGTDSLIQTASRPAAGGAWSAPEGLSPIHAAAATPQVAINPAGEAVAIWNFRNPSSLWGLQAATRPAGGVWDGLNLGARTEAGANPQVAVDSQADAVAVWQSSDGANEVVRASSRPAGGAGVYWSAAANLSAAGADAERPQVAVDPQGNAVAVWECADGSDRVTRAATRPAGDAWRPAANVSAAGWDTYFPQVAVDPQGNAVAVWGANDGSGYVVQAAGYDAAGPELRGLSIPATGTVGRPVRFAVSPLDVVSPHVTTSWAFGDGASAAGAAPTHTYTAPGAYRVTVAAVDAVGNASTAAGTIAIVRARRGIAIAARIARVKRGKALLRLRCHGPGRCRGVVKLTFRQKPRRAAGRRGEGRRSKRGRRVLLGRAKFRIAAGGRRTLRVKLRRKARRLVRKTGRRGFRAQLRGSGVKHRAVKLKPARHRGRRRR